jgi:hypothetical protein
MRSRESVAGFVLQALKPPMDGSQQFELNFEL